MEWDGRGVDKIVEDIRHSDGHCVFLIGAGFSKSAGVPLAGELIAEVREKFPEAFKMSKNQNNYNSVMTELSPQQRHSLLLKHIESAKVNLAHLALAEMLKAEKIDRVLTTNFDPLVVRACGLAGFFPAVYDLATSGYFKPGRIAKNAVFYLNGQHTGFVTLNATNELDQHKEKLRKIVQETGVKRTWVVVGYSGVSDPLADVLGEIEQYEGALYWVGLDKVPSKEIKEKILQGKERYAFYIGGMDADAFMMQLATKLLCFPPKLLHNPFEHLIELIKHIDLDSNINHSQSKNDSLKNLSSEQSVGYLSQLRDQVVMQIESVIQRESAEKTQVLRNFISHGKFREAIDAAISIAKPSKEQKIFLATAYVGLANEYYVSAQAQKINDVKLAIDLLDKSLENYVNALKNNSNNIKIKSSYGYALIFRGALVDKSDFNERKRYWDLACKEFEESTKVKSKFIGPYNGWGNALYFLGSSYVELGRTDEAKNHYSKAIECYKKHLELEPQAAFVLSNIAGVYLMQTRIYSEAEKIESLLQTAEQYLNDAYKISPDEPLLNLACLFALRGNSVKSIEYLDEAKELGVSLNKKEIDEEKDFDKIRGSDEFKAWYELTFSLPKNIEM